MAGVLLKHVEEDPGQPGAGSVFRRYEQRMRGFVERNQQLGPKNVKGMAKGSQAATAITLETYQPAAAGR